jgi:hypothetical protein
VQASAAPQAASASESDPEDEGEDDEIVKYKPVSHPRSDVKGNLANQPKKTDYFRVDSNWPILQWVSFTKWLSKFNRVIRKYSLNRNFYCLSTQVFALKMGASDVIVYLVSFISTIFP